MAALERAEIYELPDIYEIAFSYRDVSQQCDFLAAVYGTTAGQPPQSVLELACGPALHAREFARRGLAVTAMDLAPEMVAYAGRKLGTEGRAVLADMADFVVAVPVDLAFTLLDSLPYLTTNERLVSHFRSVRRALRDGGVYVVELRHPADARPGGEPTTVTTWTVEREGLRVTTEWGADLRYDPVRQTEQVRSRITVEGPGHTRVLESVGVMRPVLPQELLLIVELAGGWRVLGWWGDFDLGRPLGGSDQDWRMIVGLQRA